MRRLLLSILVLATLVPRASRAAGVSLRWDNCYSDGGVANRTFACDANTGSERLVMSFVLGTDMPQVSGTEIRLFAMSATATMPTWWQFFNAGSCRRSSLSLNFGLPVGSANCVDWTSGNGAGGIGSYNIGFFGPNSAFLQAAVAVPPTGLETLAAGQEYFAGNLLIDHAKTVGSGACAGCDQPVCLVLDRVRVTTPVLEDNVNVQGPAFGSDSDFARWQNGQETNVQFGCDGPFLACYHTYSCVLATTPTRASTWGAVKALYR